MNFEELKKLGAAALADIICSEITVLDSKIKELQEKIKEYEGLDDTDSSYMEMAYGFKLNECEGAKDRLLMLARIERDRQAKEQKRKKWVRADEQIIVANIMKDGEIIARMPIGTGVANSFKLSEAISVPDGCTIELHAFADPEDAEAFTKSL